jgi:transcriptional regulator with XRE-family HTH domain
MKRQFGDYLRLIRLKSGMALREVAELAGVDVSLLSKIERGERSATSEMIPKLAFALEISEQDLKTKYLFQKILDEVNDDSSRDEVLAGVVQEIKKLK